MRALSFLAPPRIADARSAENTDEGVSFGTRGVNNASALEAVLYGRYPAITNASVAAILEGYPNDPSIGCPFGTGDGLEPFAAFDPVTFSNAGWGANGASATAGVSGAGIVDIEQNGQVLTNCGTSGSSSVQCSYTG